MSIRNKSVKKCLLCLRVPLETLLGYSQKLYDNEETAQKVAEKAAKLLRSAYLKSPADMCGKTPKGLMAGALYLAGLIEGERKNQDTISQVAGVSLATIHARYTHLVDLLNLATKSVPFLLQRAKANLGIESCWAEDCEHNRSKSCCAPTISLITINVRFRGQPIVICRCLEYNPKNRKDHKRRKET